MNSLYIISNFIKLINERHILPNFNLNHIMLLCLIRKNKSCVGHFTHQNDTSIYRMSTNFVQEGKFSRAGFLEMTRATFSHQWSQMWGWLSPVFTRVMALGLWKFLISLASGYMYFPALNQSNFEFHFSGAPPPPPALFSMC